MEQVRERSRWRLPAFVAFAAGAAILLRGVVAALAIQLAAAAVLMLLALPICRFLEQRLPGGAAAVASLMALAIGAVVTLALLLPPVVKQIQQLTAAFPDLLAWLRMQWLALSAWISEQGVDLSPMQGELFSGLSDAFSGTVTRLMAAVARFVSGLGKVLLAPLLAFYLLRDRKRIASGLTLLLPVRCRARGVRAAREMRRETSAYLRGQLLLSLSVGSLTAAGLLLTRTPGWLLLGILMGILELVPYAGPLIAGLPAVLLSLQNGLIPAAWTLGVLVLIQQLEGAVLSPRLLGSATRLHPMAVLLLVSAGGIVAGAAGMVLVIPAVVSLRGALRGWRT